MGGHLNEGCGDTELKDTTKISAASPSGQDDGRTDGVPAGQVEQANYYGLQILPPLTAVIELAAIVGVILAIDWLWPALDINNLQPSPYWLPVLLLTLQYGTASGTMAVIVAIAAYFSFVTLPEQGVVENEFAYRLRILSQPILWIVAAVVLGQFRMVQISARREMARQLVEMETQRNTLADYAKGLRNRCDALEREIIARPFYAGATLLDALADLPAPRGQLSLAVERCLSAAFPGAAISVFLRQGDQLVKAASSGWPVHAPWMTALPADHPLARAVTVDKRPVSILTAAGETVLSQQGLAAVALVSSRTGRAIGMIKIEAADARLISSDLVKQLDVLGAAIEPQLVETAHGVAFDRAGVDENEDGRAAGVGAAVTGRQTAHLVAFAHEGTGTSEPASNEGEDGSKLSNRISLVAQLRPKVGG